MEPALVSKKRGMSRNMSLSEVQGNPKIITKRALAVLCASIVSTDGVMSAPLQLGAKLLLSRASVLCPGLEMWNKPLDEIDSKFTQDVLRYVKSIERYKDILPLDRKVVRVGDRIDSVYIYHDASVSSIGVIIYVQIVDGTGKRHFRIVRSGTKCANLSVPVLEHISRSYALVLLRPMLSVLK